MPFRLSVVAGLLALFAFTAPATADPVEVHYAPVENLERVDVALLQSARSKIDLTAFSLTDWPVIDALVDAHRRGVVVRVVLDPSERHALDRLTEVSDGIRMKPAGPYMHLKSYSIDGLVLRSGSANLTASGLSSKTTTSSSSMNQQLPARLTRVSSRYGQRLNRFRELTRSPYHQRVGQNSQARRRPHPYSA